MRWVGKESIIFSLGLVAIEGYFKLNVLFPCKNTISVSLCYSNWIRILIRSLPLAFFNIWTLECSKIICPETEGDHLMMREMQ